MKTTLASLRRAAKRVATTSLLLVAPMWALEFVDALVLRGGLDRFGVVPRDIVGAWGVLFAPLLHGGFAHLASNTIGLLVFGGLVAAIGRREWLCVVALGWLGAGAGVWLLGRPGMHIGASGVAFALFGFLLLRGWYQRSLGAVSLSLAVLWGFGELLWGMVPLAAGHGISWEGHLFGFLAGAGCALRLSKRQPTQEARAS